MSDAPSVEDLITLARSTVVEPRDGQSFEVALDARWNRLTGAPLGGYTLAATLRALGEVMPFGEPLVASAFFLRPAAVGAARVTTELVRRGRTVATGQASLHQAGREVLRLTATYGDVATADGPTVVSGAPPVLPPPEACVDPLGELELPGVSITDRVEYRCEAVPGWRDGRPSGASEQVFWMRLRAAERIDAPALALLVDAAAPGVFELGAAGSSTLELTVHFRGRPSSDWLACRCITRFLVDGYHEEDFEIWDTSGRLVALSRQFAVAS